MLEICTYWYVNRWPAAISPKHLAGLVLLPRYLELEAQMSAKF